MHIPKESRSQEEAAGSQKGAGADDQIGPTGLTGLLVGSMTAKGPTRSLTRISHAPLMLPLLAPGFWLPAPFSTARVSPYRARLTKTSLLGRKNFLRIAFKGGVRQSDCRFPGPVSAAQGNEYYHDRQH